MNIIIIEDEKLAAERLEKMIKEYDPETEIIFRADSVKKSVDWLNNNAEYTASPKTVAAKPLYQYEPLRILPYPFLLFSHAGHGICKDHPNAIFMNDVFSEGY